MSKDGTQQEQTLKQAGTMTADSLDNYDYQRASEHTTEAMRKHYWAVAIGLQDVDGLRVSSYLQKTAQAYVSGDATLKETGELVRAYHAKEQHPDTAEADLVSQRIAELLAAGAFCLAPEMLKRIHRYLFQDLDPAIYHPGEFKSERMVKQEEILNGDSVLYADPLTYDLSIAAVFNAEAKRYYTTFDEDELKSFSHSIAFLWQVHPFYEGNTRTVAVFSELYLNFLGFSVSNAPFEKHARYFRDALVRAMYRNVAAGILPNQEFLVRFFKNIVGAADDEFNRADLMCNSLFEHPELLRNVSPLDALVK